MLYTLKMLGPAGVLLLLLQLMHVYSQQPEQVPDAFINCTFESNCPDIIYDTTDDHSYGWRKVRIPTSSSGTGPDMNTGNAKPGFYLYADASYGNDGDKASIRTRYPMQTNSSHFCLSFRYHMYGADVGGLDVKLTADNPYYEEGVFTQRGNQRNIWHEEYVDFQVVKNTKFTLNIEARRGNGHVGDIAIDDIYLFKAKCSDFCQLWQPWASCSVTCGQGLKLRTRKCSGAPRYELAQCEEAKCSEWSVWGPWTQCSRTCGQGYTSSRRRCLLGNCLGFRNRTKTCTGATCPVWGTWENWQTCSRTCDSGTKIRTRRCQHGTSCTGPARESGGCTERPCPVWGRWGTWEACSTTCGQGIQASSRHCLHGTSCSGYTRRTRRCIQMPCPSVWGPWGAPTKCSVTYGYGVRHRSRGCASGPCTGQSKTETLTCFVNPETSFWAPWSIPSSCTVSCGYGTAFRSRRCLWGPCYGQIQNQSFICHTAVCQGIMQCDFERKDCKLLSHMADWFKVNRSSFYGIRGDHTTGKGKFLLKNGSYTEYLNVTTLKQSNEVCLRFWLRANDCVNVKTSQGVRLVSICNLYGYQYLWTRHSVTTKGTGLQIGCNRPCEIDDISVQVGRCIEDGMCMFLSSCVEYIKLTWRRHQGIGKHFNGRLRYLMSKGESTEMIKLYSMSNVIKF